MRNISIALLLIPLIFGCATATKTYTSDGDEGYSINCSGSALNWGMCYEKAGELCGKKGYEVLEKSGDRGSMLSGNQFGLYAGSVINRSMIIKCKALAADERKCPKCGALVKKDLVKCTSCGLEMPQITKNNMPK